jgi:hypothetical protein
MPMAPDVTLLNHTIARIRRDIRLHSRQMLAMIDRDEDCSAEAQLLMRAQTDLRLYLDRQEQMRCP